MENVYNVLLELSLIILANVLSMMHSVKSLMLIIKFVKSVILGLFWILERKFVLMLHQQQLILIVKVLEMLNVLNALSDSIKIKMENVKQLILHAGSMILIQEIVMVVTMDTNLSIKNVKKMNLQLMIPIVQNGKMENV